ncbi:MAG: hypothetical protein ACR2LY_05250 [Thermoleophilaceae bacterium]
MSRVLIVGCGCRGQELAAALVAGGHAVRGTTRHSGRIAAIEAVGAQAVVADPDRLGTLTRHVEGVSVLCWLMGTAVGEPDAIDALHGPRLESMLEALVDTPVRGVVYEAAGTVAAERLEEGAAAVRRAAALYRMPVEVVSADPGRSEDWVKAMVGAVDSVLAA